MTAMKDLAQNREEIYSVLVEYEAYGHSVIYKLGICLPSEGYVLPPSVSSQRRPTKFYTKRFHGTEILVYAYSWYH